MCRLVAHLGVTETTLSSPVLEPEHALLVQSHAEERGVPPFASGPFAFMHNGAIEGFRHGPMRALRDSLGDESYEGLLGVTDSETVFAVVLDRLAGGPGPSPARGGWGARGEAAPVVGLKARPRGKT